MDSTDIILKGLNKAEIIDALYDVMYIYQYNPQGSDYSCGFCHNRPTTNQSLINHDRDCMGKQLLQALGC